MGEKEMGRLTEALGLTAQVLLNPHNQSAQCVRPLLKRTVRQSGSLCRPMTASALT